MYQIYKHMRTLVLCIFRSVLGIGSYHFLLSFLTVFLYTDAVLASVVVYYTLLVVFFKEIPTLVHQLLLYLLVKHFRIY